MSKKEFIAGSALGALIGSVAALLLAPQSGSKTRKDLQKMAGDVSARVTKELPHVKKLTKETYEALVEKVVVDYKKGKKFADKVWDDLRSDLKSQWKQVEKTLKG